MITKGQILGKAHKVVELLNAGIDGEKMPFFARQVERSVKWALPGANEMPDPDPQLLRGAPLHLPNQDVLLECDWEFVFPDGDEKGTAIGILTEAAPGEIFGMFLSLTPRGLGFAAEVRITTNQDTGDIQIHAVAHPEMERNKDTYCATVAEHAGVVVSWLAALRCVNVLSLDNPPPEALNRKRTKQGKPPIFTYKTLHISQKRPRSHGEHNEDSDRTPPRLHGRRGHFRRLDEQRLIWVRPCMVGNKELGVVEKDYALDAR